MKKSGFTMIELIFVIVILGILAAVAIPKLAATRNDAKIAAEMTNVSQIITNLGAEYTSQGAFRNIEPNAEGSSLKCFTLETTGTIDTGRMGEGNFSVTVIPGATTACPQAVLDGVTAKAEANGITEAAGATKEYSFGSIGIVE